MKHVRPELDNLTNADIAAAQDAASVIGSVGVVTTAAGGDTVGDIVINAASSSIGAPGSGSPTTTEAPAVGTISCESSRAVYNNVHEGSGSLTNTSAVLITIRNTFYSTIRNGEDIDTVRFIQASASNGGQPNDMQNSIYEAAGITNPVDDTLYTVGGANDMTPFNIFYDQNVSEGTFVVTISSIYVSIGASVVALRLGGTDTVNTGPAGFMNLPSFQASDFIIAGTGTYRAEFEPDGSTMSGLTDRSGDFTIGCVNPSTVGQTTVCTGGTTFNNTQASGTNGGGGYQFVGQNGQGAGTALTNSSFQTIEFNGTDFPINNSEPVSLSVIEEEFLSIGNFSINRSARNLNNGGGQIVRNAPADFNAFNLSFTQEGDTTASFSVLVSSITYSPNVDEVFLGGTGGSPTVGSNPTGFRAFQDSDFVVDASGTYLASEQSNTAPFPFTRVNSGTWGVDVVCGPSTGGGDTTTTIIGDTTTTGDINVGGDINTPGDGSMVGPLVVTTTPDTTVQSTADHTVTIDSIAGAPFLTAAPNTAFAPLVAGARYRSLAFSVGGTAYVFAGDWQVAKDAVAETIVETGLINTILIATGTTTTWMSLETMMLDAGVLVLNGNTTIGTGDAILTLGSGTLTTYDVDSGSVISSTRDMILSTGINEIRLSGSGIDKTASDATPLGLVVGDNGHIMTTTSSSGLTLPTANNTILANNGDSTALVASAITQTFTPAEEGEDEVTTIIGGSSLTINPAIVNIPTFSDIARDSIVTNDRLLLRDANGRLARSSAVSTYFPTAGEVPTSWDDLGGATINATANNIPFWDGDSFEDSPIALTPSSSSFTFDLAIPFTGTVEQNQANLALQQDSDLVIADGSSTFRDAVASGSAWSTVTFVHFDNRNSGSFWERTSNAASAPFVQGITTDSFIVLYTDDNNWAVISPISTNQVANSLNVSVEASMGVTPTIGNQITIGFIPSATYPLPAVETTITGGINVTGLPNAADDTAAATAGVPVNGLYRNGSQLMIRIS